MGIGLHELSFLKFVKKKNNFKTLGVLGRQENYINPNESIIPKNLKNFVTEKYSDNLLKNILTLDSLKSYDVSSKDNPSEILNFNFPINNTEKFDAFFDGGSLQHTFNIPIVMQNIINHVKIGGSIIHVVSSNNLCGFGFYQFSPEFFIRYYSEKNGFKNTSVFVADYDDKNYWYEINPNVANMGNIEEKSFKEIWNSEKYNNLREKISTNNLEDYCKNCYFEHRR